jgi:hypothetical protein
MLIKFQSIMLSFLYCYLFLLISYGQSLGEPVNSHYELVRNTSMFLDLMISREIPLYK